MTLDILRSNLRFFFTVRRSLHLSIDDFFRRFIPVNTILQQVHTLPLLLQLICTDVSCV